MTCVRIIRGVERCRAVSSGVERCRAWHLDSGERGTSLDGVEGCRGVSRGVELVELAWGVEVSSWCRGLVSRCRGQGSAQNTPLVAQPRCVYSSGILLPRARHSPLSHTSVHDQGLRKGSILSRLEVLANSSRYTEVLTFGGPHKRRTGASHPLLHGAHRVTHILCLAHLQRSLVCASMRLPARQRSPGECSP